MMMSSSPAATQPATLDSKLFSIFMNSMTTVLQTMAQTEIKLKNATPSSNSYAHGDISCVIGITGDAGEGLVAISFPEKLGNILVGRIMGLEPNELEKDDYVDGVAEIGNMVSGYAKTALSANFDATFKLSLPSIIKGKGHEIAGGPKNTPFLVLFFEAEGEDFTLQVSFKPN
jgi:CheY-specific phosphatase CheX